MTLYAIDDNEKLYGIEQNWQNQPAEAGISFMIRSRAEERTLDMAIHSLKAVSVPHEIVLVTNGPEVEIPDEWPVRHFTYSPNLSRPGVENLITPVDSIHSMVWFSNWSHSKTRFSYIFRFDADFIASRFLLDQLPSVLSNPPAMYSIKAGFADTLKGDAEYYLYPKESEPYYEKYYFWEFMKMRHPCPKADLSGSILHDSSLTRPKDHLAPPAWWIGTEEGEELERKCQEIVNKVGIRFARASDPETHGAFFKYLAMLPEEAIIAQPTDYSFLNLSLAYYRVGRYLDCIRAAKRAIELHPDYAVAYNNISAAYNRLGNYEEGKRAAEKALHIEPNNQLAKNNFAWSIRELNKK